MHPCSRPGCLLPLPTSLSLSAHILFTIEEQREKRRRMKKKHVVRREGGAKDRRRKVAALFSRALVFSPLSRSTEIKRLLPGRPTPSKDPRVCTHTTCDTHAHAHKHKSLGSLSTGPCVCRHTTGTRVIVRGHLWTYVLCTM